MFLEWSRFKDVEVLIDIRHSINYDAGHLPQAISLPFQIDLKKIKQAFRQKKDLDDNKVLDHVRDFEPFLEKVNAFAGKSMGFYCDSGGLRSHYLSQLLGDGFHFLKNGFQGYIDDKLSILDIDFDFILLEGFTGSGKTEILRALARAGQQVIDLEEITGHSGSVFGASHKHAPPTQLQFELEIASMLEGYKVGLPIYIEQKGKSIGGLHVPFAISKKLMSSPTFFLDVPKEVRLTNLVNRYAKLPKSILMSSILKLGDRLNHDEVICAIDFLKNDEFRACAGILLKYYDGVEVYSSGKQGAMIIPYDTQEKMVAHMILLSPPSLG